MVQTIKVRKNKSDTRRRMKGGDGPLDVAISSINNVKSMCKYGALTTLKAGIPELIKNINIPTEYDEPLKKLLGTEAKMADLFTDCINALECDDIDIFIEILPKVFVIDKIGKLLETPNLSNIDEAAKTSLPLFDELKEIIDNKNFQNFICRILNEMESKEHIPDGSKEKFIEFYVGPEKAKEICESKSALGSIKKMGSSFMTSVSNINNSAVNTNDKRCCEDLIVKKSIFSGEYCAPKPAPKVVKATMPEQVPPAKEDQKIPAEPVKGGNRRKYNRANKSKKNKKSKSKKSKRSKK
jgi:hypothetical protein